MFRREWGVLRPSVTVDDHGAQPSASAPGTRFAPTWCVRRSVLLLGLIWWGLAAGVPATRAAVVQTERETAYRTEKISDGAIGLRDRFTAYQLAVLEQLNRADLEHLVRLRELVVPESWVPDDLAYSVLPARYLSSEPFVKLLVVHLPGQVFGAYESGALVRWGPVSSGRRSSPTPTGLLQLNWRSIGRASTIDPDWFMRWYFNFGNRQGLAFHEYSLPGEPASHGCVRLLERDAQWLFEWGEAWTLDASGTRVQNPGTPVFFVGRYDFDAPPPWRSPAWLAQAVELPPLAWE